MSNNKLPSNNMTRENLLALAKTAMQEQKWQLAQERWQKVIKLLPNQIVAYNGLGNSLIELGDFEQAKTVFEQIIQRYPQFYHGFLGLARIAMKEQQWQLAKDQWKNIIDKFPDLIGAKYGLANTLIQLREFKAAEIIFTQIIEDFSEEKKGFYGLAKIAMATQQWQLAQERWQNIIKRFPDNTDAYLSLIDVLILLEDFNAATKVWQKLPNKKKNIEQAFTQITKIAFYTNKWQIAIAAFFLLTKNNRESLKSLDRNYKLHEQINYFFNLLIRSKKIKELELIIAKIKQEVSEESNYLKLNFVLWQSWVVTEKAQYQLAHKLCQNALEHHVNYIDTLYLQKARIFSTCFDFQNVINTCKLINISNQHGDRDESIALEASTMMSRALIILDRIDEAKKHLNQAIKIFPKQAYLYILLIEILYFNDYNYQAALDICQLAIEREIWHQQIILYQAINLSALSKTGEALAIVDNYLAQVPSDRFAMMYRVQILRDNQQYQASLAQLNQILISGGYEPIQSIGQQCELTIPHLQCQLSETIEAEEMVSVIMTTYKRNNLLPIAIDSILNQTYCNLELIIVDDGSPDDTVEWLEEFATKDNRICVVSMAQNRGTYVAKNEGMLLAQGDYITFMDSDDWVHPQKIAAQINVLKNSDAVSVTCGFFRIDNNNNLEFKPEIPLCQADITLCFKKKIVLEKIGFFDAVRTLGDDEYEQRIKTVFGIHSIKEIKEPLLIATRHKQSISGGGWQSMTVAWHGNHQSTYPYIHAYSTWHRMINTTNENPYLPHPLDKRRFTCPPAIIS